ncbi:MAG: adenylate kinase [Clostridiaceae bacterium]|nr:adenylate kinase [Eubacteriales bacterium]
MILVLLGAPGAGKGTLAAEMCSSFKLKHISTGDMLRQNMREETALGIKARSFVDAGKLVPDALIIEMVRERISMPDCKEGCLLDGFPRTAAQAEALGAIAHVDMVLYLEVETDALVKRISGRRVCEGCGAVYHISWHDGDVCPKCGAKLLVRDDDKPETVLRRIEVYNQNTEPLIGYYREKGLLRTVDGSGTPEEVFAAVRGIMEKRV